MSICAQLLKAPKIGASPIHLKLLINQDMDTIMQDLDMYVPKIK